MNFISAPVLLKLPISDVHVSGKAQTVTWILRMLFLVDKSTKRQVGNIKK